MDNKFTKEDRQTLQMCIPRNMGVFLAEAAQHLLDDYDAARAEAARLREAITNYRKWYDTCSYDLSSRAALLAATDASVRLDDALSIPADDWLERKIAEATREDREELDRIDASVHRCCPTAHGVHDALDQLAALREERDGLAAKLKGAETGFGHANKRIFALSETLELVERERDALIARVAEGEQCKRNWLDTQVDVARIRREARKAGLLEAYERVKNIRGCNAYDVIDAIQELAQEAINETR